MQRKPIISNVTLDPVTVTVVTGPYVQEIQVNRFLNLTHESAILETPLRPNRATLQ